MEKSMEKIDLPSKSVGTRVSERRKTRRYRFMTHVDILAAGDTGVYCGRGCFDILAAGDTGVYWGSMRNMSWTGVALCARQLLKSGQRVIIRFRFHDVEGREEAESLASKVIWRSGDNVGLEFEPPLTPGSPALKQSPFLVAHLMMKDA
jgi:hypothetical protein